MIASGVQTDKCLIERQKQKKESNHRNGTSQLRKGGHTVSEEKGGFLDKFSPMNVAQLQVIVNDLHTQIGRHLTRIW
ncbi:hypothetical protein NQ317_000410 [Molorchus minor]|uniref:Schwannomin interacting protein 1 C-terminal domain-containing protein n=1 Tax=Molorchus minor TaxID=1323400 RepID=A0ABQ9J9L1_9CUCU|nr:hypothetical protein NQ317_000410 [Molorchus minor]